MNNYKKYNELRKGIDEIYPSLIKEIGDIRLGPSKAGGVYIKMVKPPRTGIITNITKEEAEHIIEFLKEAFEL